MSGNDTTATPNTGHRLQEGANDPATKPAQSLVVPLDQIHTYERNPRRGTNPEYQRIKTSIRQTGLDHPLVITRRPGATDYIVHSGGNTRLLVLKALLRFR